MPDYQYLFGPLPSRRFGRSLGVDLVPFKTCSLSCRFCQLGPTPRPRIERRAYVPTDALLSELTHWVQHDGRADVITLAGSGEPTLHTGFGDILAWISHHTEIPSLLLSNGSLFADPAVRDAATRASIVKIALHAADADTFAAISQPHADIDFEAMLSGYQTFRAQFKGKLVLECFVVPGFNDTPTAMTRIARLATTFQPDHIDLNTAVRPSADPSMQPLDAVTLLTLAHCFDPPARIPGDAPASAGDPSDRQLCDLLRRHPSSTHDLVRFFTLPAATLETRLKHLAEEGRLQFDAASGCWMAPEPKTASAP